MKKYRYLFLFFLVLGGCVSLALYYHWGKVEIKTVEIKTEKREERSVSDLDNLEKQIKSLHTKADKLLDAGNYVQALKTYGDIETLCRHLYGRDNERRLSVLLQVGKLCFRLYYYEEALEALQEVLAFYEKKGVDFMRLEADTHLCIGDVYRLQERYEEALSCYNKALNFYGNGQGCEAAYVKTMCNIGKVYKAQGKCEEALDQYEDACTTFFDKDPYPATVCIAEFYAENGAYKEALAYYEEGLALCEKSVGSEHPDYAELKNGIGTVYAKMGLYQEALEHYEEAIAIYKKNGREMHPHCANFLFDLGGLYYSQGLYEKGIHHFETALSIYETCMGSDDLDCATILENIGDAYASQELREEASSAYERAKIIHARNFGTLNPCFTRLWQKQENLEFESLWDLGLVALFAVLFFVGGCYLGSLHSSLSLAKMS